MRRNAASFFCALAIVCLAPAASAVDSREWELTTVDNFLAGEFDGVMLEAPGTLRVGLATRETPVDASHVWSVVQDSRGTVYAGTGNDGRLFIIAPDGTEAQSIELEGSQVYALAVDADDTVYAATSPNGAVFRVQADGTVEEWYRPEATYIWDLLVTRNGTLYAATGDPATLIRVTGQAKGEAVYEGTAPHFLSLAEHADGRILVGAEGTGVVTAVSTTGTVRAVYDAPVSEIRSLMCTPDGITYFVGVQTATKITTPGRALKLSGLSEPPQANSAQVDSNGTPKPPPTPSPPIVRAGAAASILYRMDADGRVAPLWTAKSQQVLGATLWGDDVLLATDAEGTLFRVTPDGLPGVVYRGRAEKLVAVTTGPDGAIIVGTTEAAAVIRLGPDAPDQSVYTSAVQDARAIARYGRIRWSAPDGGAPAALRVRTGNTQEPDDAWSAWSDYSTDHAGTDFGVSDGRFLQFGVRWNRRRGGAAVGRVNIPFAPRNLPPRVLKIEVKIPHRTEPVAPNAGVEADSVAVANLLSRYANGVKPKNDAKTNAKREPSTYKLTWKTVDPNDDTLEHAVYFRGTGERLWKELETELTKAEYTWDTTLVPDGWYELRVVSSDRPSNAAAEAEEGERISERVLVDNTGPVVGKLHLTGGPPGGAVQVSGSAADAQLPLRQGRYSLDGQPWLWFAPDDGIFDSPKETFSITFEGLAPGEHTVAVQLLDAARNSGSGKQVFHVK